MHTVTPVAIICCRTDRISVLFSKLLLICFIGVRRYVLNTTRLQKTLAKRSPTLFMEHNGGFSKVPCDEWPASSKFGCVNGGQGRREWGGIGFWKAPQRQSLNNHVSSAGLHYPPVRQAECQPGLLAGCGKVNGGGKTSYCVTLERNGEGRPSVSSGLPYPQSKWTRAARGDATDTHRAKPKEHNSGPAKKRALIPLKHIYMYTHREVKAISKKFGSSLCLRYYYYYFFIFSTLLGSHSFRSRWQTIW